MMNLIAEPCIVTQSIDSDVSEQEARERAARRGARLACAVAARYETRDVYKIAARAGVRIVRRRWALVTAGECDHTRREIAINLAAVERAVTGRDDVTIDDVESLIISHELGHFFDHAWRAPRSRDERRYTEDSAHAFAAELSNHSPEHTAIHDAVVALSKESR